MLAGFIAKQPNGLYCRFSTVVDCPTHINMTKEDYLNNVTGTVLNREEGEKVLKRYLQPFKEVIDRYTPLNMTRNDFRHLLEKMSNNNPDGYEVT